MTTFTNSRTSQLYCERCNGTGYITTALGKLPCLTCSASEVSNRQDQSEVVSNRQESGERMKIPVTELIARLRSAPIDVEAGQLMEAAANRMQDLEIERDTLAHGVRLANRRYEDMAAQLAAPVAPGMDDAIHGQELLRWNRAQGDAAPIKIGKELGVARKARELMAPPAQLAAPVAAIDGAQGDAEAEDELPECTDPNCSSCR